MPLYFDIETDGLLDVVSRFHVIIISDGREFWRFDQDSRPISDALSMLESADEIIGHNIIGYDIPATQKLVPSWSPKGRITDTLVTSRLLWPDLKSGDFRRIKNGFPGKLVGKHSLEAWGYRLGILKGTYGKQEDAWDHWSPEMSEYCEQDVRVTVQLHEKIKEKPCSPEALELEHQVATIISRQERKGFLFDLGKAKALHQHLLVEKEALLGKLQETFPPFYLPGKEFIPKADNSRFGYKAGAKMTKLVYTEFNPNSRDHVALKLKEMGWEPQAFTETGKVKIDDEVLHSLPYPEANLIGQYMTIQKRLGQLSDGNAAWLKYVKQDGRIHGAVNSNGAVTGRMTHFSPNMAQVPAGYSPYGKECRELFTVPAGYKLVGCDASGLEARCLAHFLSRYDGGAFAKTVLEGKKDDGTDVHTVNAKALGTTRDTAKTWFYAWMYGAGVVKLGAILGGGAKEGKLAGDRFMRKMPAFKRLIDGVQGVVKQRGYLKGLDGRHLKIRSEHAALNTLLQSAGALIMKKALVLADAQMKAEGLTYEFVGNIHDEAQMEVLECDAERAGQIFKSSIRLAGEHFGFRCPLDGEYEIGDNWAETH